MNKTMKKALLSAAVAAAMGTSVAASADTVLNFNWTGYFTMLDPTGAFLANTSAPYATNQFSGKRSAITGTISFDINAGTGSGTVVPFNFFNGSSPATATGITMQAIGNGTGGPGTLVLGNMLFNWSGNNGIPVSIVMDAAGLFGYVGGGVYNVGDTVSGTGALPASNTTKTTLQIGPAPIATTTWNTTTINCVAGGGTTGPCMGVSPSGGLPLIADTIGGSPMPAGPFQGYNANFDVMSLTLASVQQTVVPVPAAVWLFGSGLLGLVGIARRKKAA